MSKQDDSQKGRCVSCGFAAKRANSGANFEFYEIPKEERETELHLMHVYVPSAGATAFKLSITQLVCIRAAADLPAEVRAFPETQKPNSEQATKQAAHQVLEKDRHCPQWYEYQSGRTPQEHIADYMWERLEEQRQRFERDREAERRAFEERMEKERREFDAGLSQRLEIDRREWIAARDEARDIDQKRNDSLMKKLTVAAVILGLAQVIAAILALTKDSWIVQLFCKWFGG